jgi:hypothetical protein
VFCGRLHSWLLPARSLQVSEGRVDFNEVRLQVLCMVLQPARSLAQAVTYILQQTEI